MGERAKWDKGEQRRIFTGTEHEEDWNSETSHKFHNLMDAAMMVSRHKYGLLADGYPEKLNAIKSLTVRLELYLFGDEKKEIPPGNVEYLVDVANFAMIEFMHPLYPGAFFKSTDSSGSPGRVVRNEQIYDKPSQVDNLGLPDAEEKPF